MQESISTYALNLMKKEFINKIKISDEATIDCINKYLLSFGNSLSGKEEELIKSFIDNSRNFKIFAKECFEI